MLLVFDARPAVAIATAENISSNKFGPFNLRSIAAFVSSLKRGSSVLLNNRQHVEVLAM